MKKILFGIVVCIAVIIYSVSIWGMAYDSGVHDGWWRGAQGHSMYGILY